MKPKSNFITASFWGMIFLLWITTGGNAIAGDPRAELTFDHTIHVESVEMGCGDCHALASQSTVPDDRLNPGKDVCADCHDVEDQSECATCHSNPQQVTPIPARVEFYDFFDHQKHLGTGLDCENCHTGAAQSTQVTSESTMLPLMADCIDCHRKEGQTLDCGACHHGVHPIPSDFGTMSWRRTHGPEAVADPERFETHFELGYCEDCHQGLNLAGDVHSQGWMFTHGAESSSGGECLICHEDRTYCSGCHRTMLPIPHPLGDPNFADPISGGSHSSDAKAFFDACISCHDVGLDDPTCARCH